MKIFIAGIMQGSNQGQGIHGQEYRQRIRDAIMIRHPGADIVDPFALFPGAEKFDDQRAKQVLFEMAAEAGASDIVVAYLPKASLGTALEMIRAYDHGKTVITISPMETNWFVRAVSAKIFPTLDDFCAWALQTDLAQLIDAPAQS